MSKCHKSDQSGLNNSARPIEAPGNVKEKITIKSMTTNSKGTKISHTLPKPSSRFLWEMNQTINHPTSMKTAMNGMKLKTPLNESVT